MTASRLRVLKSKFAKFRAEYRPHTRIPDALRREVLAAIAAGIGPSVCSASLKLSTSQIAIWRRRVIGPKAVIAEDEPRVLEVVSAVPTPVLPAGLRVSYEAGRLLLELSC